MLMAPRAKNPMLSREKTSTGVKSQKSCAPVSLPANNDQEGAKSPDVMTLTSCTIREGAKQGSSGAKRKYVPASTSLSDNSQMSEGYKLSNKYLDDEVDSDAFAAMNRDQGWT